MIKQMVQECALLWSSPCGALEPGGETCDVVTPAPQQSPLVTR